MNFVKSSQVVVAASLVATLAFAGCKQTPGSPEPEPPRGFQGRQFLQVAALGDSITLGTNACGKPGECRFMSWSTGNDGGTDSFAARLGEATGHQPATRNFAKGGAKAEDLPAQAEAAVAAGADVVTILIGSNDACAPAPEQMTSPADFSTSVSQALATLDAGAGEPLVFIVSIPHLKGLLSAHHGTPAALRIWKRNQVCQSLLAEPASAAEQDQQRRDAVAARVGEYNQVLAERCAAVSRCISDGGAVSTINFSAGRISELDYFHPSKDGQAALGKIAWAALSDAVDHCELPEDLKEDFGC